MFPLVFYEISARIPPRDVIISDALAFVMIAIALVMLFCCYSAYDRCFGGVIALVVVDAMVFLIGLVFCVMSVMSVADVNDHLNCLVDAAVVVLAGLIQVVSLVGETTFAVLASAKFWFLDAVVSTTDGLDGLVRGAVLVGSVGLTLAELLSKEVYDLLVRGIDYHHFLPLGRFPQPASEQANFALFALIIIVVICFKLSPKYTHSTKGQNHPEIMRRDTHRCPHSAGSSGRRSTSRCCVANRAQRMLNMLRIILHRYWCHRCEYQRVFTGAICDLPSLFLPWMHSEDSRSEGYIKLWRCAREDFVLLLFGGGCILSYAAKLSLDADRYPSTVNDREI
jgi:hypothetical protein